MTLPLATLAGLVLFGLQAPTARAAGSPLEGVRRVVFVGDSITYAGTYIEQVETVLKLRDPKSSVEFLNLGLPSETVSGLSEPGHADGAFPRPVLSERLERVLSRTKPDLVVACYGMNDGIYHPFDEARFAAFREGMSALRDRAKAHGAKVLHLTPPVFDPEPIRAKTLPAGLAEYRQPFVDYDDVLARYSDWLLSRRADGWDVVDVHGPLRAYLDRERAKNPKFRLAKDGVHLDADGHWRIARALLIHWGVPAAEVSDSVKGNAAVGGKLKGTVLLVLIRKRSQLLRDAWLGATGHKRPGIKAGPPLDQAEREAAAITKDIESTAILNAP